MDDKQELDFELEQQARIDAHDGDYDSTVDEEPEFEATDED